MNTRFVCAHPVRCGRMKISGAKKLFAAVIAFAAAASAAGTGHAQSTYEPYTINTLAGFAGSAGSTDGTGSAARFSLPFSVAADGAGNIYVADFGNDTIRKIAPGGVVTTLAGSAGQAGSSDGTGNAARFYAPAGVATDSAGNVYVADTHNQTIRKITSGGVVTTLAGLAGAVGSADGTGSAARFSYPGGVAVDGAGNVYVADQSNNTIRKITAGGVVTTLAGSAGQPGSADGTGSAARFNLPQSVAVDSAGNIYVADTSNHTIRKVTPGGTVTTLAGSAGNSGSTDGNGNNARFNNPNGVAVDSAGNVYVGDTHNNIVRKITPGGIVTTLAGTAGSAGSTDGTGSAARFNFPTGVAVDNAGNLYVADFDSNTIRVGVPVAKYEPYVISTLAGFPGSAGSNDGTGSGARFYFPSGVAMDNAGNLYVADQKNCTIRKITPGGMVTTLAGLAGSSGSADGTGSAARFNTPWGVSVDSAGNVYVADYYNYTVRKITPSGVVTTLAGLAGQSGSADGTGNAARFKYPSGIAVDGAGNVYVADYGNDTIRKISPAGAVTTLAGSAGQFGSTDGGGGSARFGNPASVALDGAGNVYVADTFNHTIRKITTSFGAVVSTLAGSAGNSGGADGTGSAARFYYPDDVAVDSAGNVYVADTSNHAIRKVTSGGVVTTLAGVAAAPGSADGIGSAVRFNSPVGIAADGAGNIYIADTENDTIRVGVPVRNYEPYPIITLAGLAGNPGTADGTGSAARFYGSSGVAADGAGNIYVADSGANTIRQIASGGVVTTLAGMAGTSGSTDGTGSAARFFEPNGVAADSAGNVYVADTVNCTIRKITAGGVVTTFAGSPLSNGSADGTGSAARFWEPYSVATDGAGNVYVADEANSTIRKITPGAVVTTLAGLAGNAGSADGTGSAARFNQLGVAADSAGNVYVADSGNDTIRKITPAGVVTTLAGFAGANGSDDGPGSSAQFYTPIGVAVDGAGNVYVADYNNDTLRKITPGGVVTTIAGLTLTQGSAEGTGSAARFKQPWGVAVDGTGAIYVADSGNYTIRAGAEPLTFSSAVSRKVHGSAGTFDINLPLTGSPGVECRSGGANGNHTLVITFNNPLVGGNATVTSGTGSVAGSPTFSGNTMSVNLTGVANVQTVTVTLSGVTDSFSQVYPSTAISASFLIGDTTGDSNVNSSDVSQTKSQSGNAVTSGNFREDVTVDGTLNSSDVSLVKSKSGTGLP